MSKPEQIPIRRHESFDELNKRIKTLEKDAKIVKRLYFLKYRYAGESVERAARQVGITKCVGYIWQKRWNEQGYAGLAPRYAGGRPSKLRGRAERASSSTRYSKSETIGRRVNYARTYGAPSESHRR